MTFVVAIPSFDRVEKLKTLTLPYLRSEGIEDPVVFLKNEQQLALYSRDISGVKFVVCNNRNLTDKKQFIIDYFPEDQPIVFIDDDIKRIKFLKQQPLKPFIERMFEVCVQENCSLWGVYPVNQTNMFYCKDRIAVGLQFICGGFNGLINKKHIRFPDLVDCEDEWLSMYMYQKEGKTVRYEGASIHQHMFGAGGCNQMRRTTDLAQQRQFLHSLFPQLCKYKIKKNGRPDVVINRQKRRFIDLYNTQPATREQQESECEAGED